MHKMMIEKLLLRTNIPKESVFALATFIDSLTVDEFNAVLAVLRQIKCEKELREV